MTSDKPKKESLKGKKVSKQPATVKPQEKAPSQPVIVGQGVKPPGEKKPIPA